MFLANAVSFAASATLVSTVRGSFSGDRHGEVRHAGVRAGFRFLFHDPVLRRMALAFSAFAICVGSVIVAELPLASSFGAGSVGYGLIATMFGIGALAGALGGRRMTPRTEPMALVIGSAITAIGFASVGLAPAFWWVLIAMLVAGTSDGVVDVAVETIFQRRSPDAVRSRVIGALEAIWHGGISISFLFSGALVDGLGPKSAYVLAGAGCAACAVLLTPLLHTRTAGDELPAAETSHP